jgi:hypothetical protein
MLESIRTRPALYFRNLAELQAMMLGHETAFAQLGLIRDNDSFHKEFSAWLFNLTRQSMAAGWAAAIDELAREENCAPNDLFFRHAQAFLNEWTPLRAP